MATLGKTPFGSPESPPEYPHTPASGVPLVKITSYFYGYAPDLMYNLILTLELKLHALILDRYVLGASISTEAYSCHRSRQNGSLGRRRRERSLAPRESKH
jgi:hypothetical protein